jgi:hypothetical protein
MIAKNETFVPQFKEIFRGEALPLGVGIGKDALS